MGISISKGRVASNLRIKANKQARYYQLKMQTKQAAATYIGQIAQSFLQTQEKSLEK